MRIACALPISLPAFEAGIVVPGPDTGDSAGKAISLQGVFPDKAQADASCLRPYLYGQGLGRSPRRRRGALPRLGSIDAGCRARVPGVEGRSEREPEDPIAALARRRFGLDYLYPYQRLVAANVLDSAAPGAEPMRQIVLLPTGFGKSLCFQLPALLLPRPTVIVYPLLALMRDQARRLGELGIPCALFRGGMGPEERKAAEASVERGETKIVISNPECLGAPRLLDFLKEAEPSHLAIDEAHCVSEWGETFRPAYLQMGRVADILAPTSLSAFTATASPVVLEAVAKILFGGSPYRVIEGDPDRPNISYAVVRTLCREHSLERLAREMPRPLLVFCSSREGAQILGRLLRERLGEEELRFYHAGLERPEKKAVEEWFFGSEKGILVTTCAYGMGVDKRNIRSVIHYEAPTSVEAYLQEAGRAGRDGLPSRAVLLAGPQEERRLAKEEDEPRRSRFRALLEYASSEEGCRRDRLLDMLGTSRAGRSPCSGCDRCEGGGREPREGEEEITAFARANSGRFTGEEALALLRGSGAGAAEPPRCALWGAMATWQAKDASLAMIEALRLGIVREGRAWPWRGRLFPGRPGRYSIMPESESSSTPSSRPRLAAPLRALAGLPPDEPTLETEGGGRGRVPARRL
jgi:ATP-dependent DNA helicase RecQ